MNAALGIEFYSQYSVEISFRRKNPRVIVFFFSCIICNQGFPCHLHFNVPSLESLAKRNYVPLESPHEKSFTLQSQLEGGIEQRSFTTYLYGFKGSLSSMAEV